MDDDSIRPEVRLIAELCPCTPKEAERFWYGSDGRMMRDYAEHFYDGSIEAIARDWARLRIAPWRAAHEGLADDISALKGAVLVANRAERTKA